MPKKRSAWGQPMSFDGDNYRVIIPRHEMTSSPLATEGRPALIAWAQERHPSLVVSHIITFLDSKDPRDLHSLTPKEFAELKEKIRELKLVGHKP